MQLTEFLMTNFKDFIKWLEPVTNNPVTLDKKKVQVFEFKHEESSEILSAWATHFRNHYCLDSQIDVLRDGTGLGRKEYLINFKFPDEKEKPGPSIRSGDFTEILLADYLEFVLNYTVPRFRYFDKGVRNESTKGVDVIGFKIFGKKDDVNDTLITLESKAKFTGKCNGKLQEAIKHSAKDYQKRKAESLNAIKQKMLYFNMYEEIEKISRFQNKTDNPYNEISGAVACVDIASFNDEIITSSTTEEHPNNKNCILIVIKGRDMMNLVHQLYEIAANEA